MFDDVRAKIKNMIKRGFVSKSMDDKEGISIAQVSYLGSIGISEILSPYGLNSRLPTGIQVAIFSVQGNENNRLSIGYSQTDRFKNLEEGEVVVGNPQTGANIKFKSDGSIYIKSIDPVTIEAPSVTIINGSININGNADIKVNGEATIDAAKTNLGIGGNEIARKGDAVVVDVGGTPYNGTITGGGTNTSI